MDKRLPVQSGPLDFVHLAEQTLADEHLQRELLELFLEQSPPLLKRMQDLAPNQSSDLNDLAHRLKGSACAIGAVHVATATEALERRQSEAERRKLLAALVAALDDCKIAIVTHLQAGEPAAPLANPAMPHRHGSF